MYYIRSPALLKITLWLFDSDKKQTLINLIKFQVHVNVIEKKSSLW